MRAVAAENLRKYNETIENISNQLDALLKAIRDSGISTQAIITQLSEIGRSLIQKHGLCIDKNCAMCRVHEEAIKEHVLVYVDWRVPGTVQKLQQARHTN
jgi:signal-transduction protein with cAMP-binding, CBS, and nucleotidyltransferase domain